MKYLANFFNNLPFASVIFDSEANLLFYNEELLNLWKISDSFLKERPNIIEFFEVIREKGFMPEKDNFREFCNDMYKLATSNKNFNKKETILLPNGQYIQENLTKNTEYLSITWEDVSEVSDIIRNLSNYKNLYNRLIEKNSKSLIIVASNGIVESYNSKFLETFNLSSDLFDEKIHVRDLLTNLNILDNKYDDKISLLGNLVSSRSFNMTISISDSVSLSVNGIYLQNSQSFVQWEINDKNATIEIDINTDSVIELHNNLIMDLNYLVGSPISNIIGFADLLKNQYIGELNLRQKDYIDKIIEKAEFVNSELNHKIEISELENQTNFDISDVDFNIILSTLLYNVKPRLQAKNIRINLDIESNLPLLKSDESLISKAISLLLMYMIEQNNNNSEIIINIEKRQKDFFTFTIKDSSRHPLLSMDDLKTRYDVNLALKIIKKLKFSIDYASKQRKYRHISIIMSSINQK